MELTDFTSIVVEAMTIIDKTKLEEHDCVTEKL